ncbi:hypothetical protein IGB42_01883 [Andreprevotia sp. IGB-42]|uniref:hypothetical protein n=1 Tax=Andreprevotia sp. IGB-42 TaxID=2497473 RepID=UPI00135BD9AE|nr:hypothetical protein [Andreprevotia sp. IGB-42]KAF0813532.1 hypothetical protein IGB42_01883 [Andreprevotia sp. IGB-42]
MNYEDVFVNRQERFAIGTETGSGQHYVSIPVSNRMVDYLEYYAIDQASYDLFLRDPVAALQFVERCRKREADDLLLHEPGADRGVAS